MNKFKVGDRVKIARDHHKLYFYTKIHSKGIVVEISSSSSDLQVAVEFYYIPGETNVSKRKFSIYIEDLELVYKHKINIKELYNELKKPYMMQG